LLVGDHRDTERYRIAARPAPDGPGDSRALRPGARRDEVTSPLCVEAY
jgi:hypothetical protein